MKSPTQRIWLDNSSEESQAECLQVNIVNWLMRLWSLSPLKNHQKILKKNIFGFSFYLGYQIAAKSKSKEVVPLSVIALELYLGGILGVTTKRYYVVAIISSLSQATKSIHWSGIRRLQELVNNNNSLHKILRNSRKNDSFFLTFFLDKRQILF